MYKSCKYIALGRTYEFAPTHFETLHNYNRYAPLGFGFHKQNE